MRKNKFFIAGLVTVFVALVSLTLVSSTWAKYTSTVEGTDSARVAKWNWTYNGGDLANTAEPLTFDLFNTIKDTAGAVEEDVDANLIAPGTSGEFKLSFTNASEVNGMYSVIFESAETVEQIQYSIDGLVWKETIAELNVTDAALDMGQNAELKMYWQWRYFVDDATDGTDTADGLAGDVEQTVKATVIFVQVD